MTKIILLLVGGWFFSCQAALAFDHSHAEWSRLLGQHVSWSADGSASTVDYRAMQKQEAALDSYLAQLTAVSQTDYSSWQKPQQLAFLINAYNAFTIKFILSEYPAIASIKELGSLFTSPWKKRFFTLLGKKRHLDEVEHELIRQPGVFSEPRIHAAVVCASIGCPGIRDEAFVAEKIDAQLEDSLRRFLSDRSRNRYNSATDKLEISKVFDWYGDDFVGFRQFRTLAAFLGSYATLLTEDVAARSRLVAGEVALDFLPYDWQLNDVRR